MLKDRLELLALKGNASPELFSLRGEEIFYIERLGCTGLLAVDQGRAESFKSCLPLFKNPQTSAYDVAR
ncbi:hypothetical protein SXCC_01908 [Gluconacetobacter sp. SXCC-1]|nr:hypothetical protein SXCC_01908 [Gluconacetobacter sp. SXCC-1]